MPTATEILRHEHDAVVKMLGFTDNLADQLDWSRRVWRKDLRSSKSRRSAPADTNRYTP